LAFPERAAKDNKLGLRIENTLADCASFYLHTSPQRTSIKNTERNREVSLDVIPYVYPENLRENDIGGVDFLNLNKQPWQYPLAGRDEDRRSFPNIYSDAVHIAVESMGPVITRYLETGIFPITEAGRVIGNGGLSIVDENGKPCAPNKTDPLPLDMVMEQQLSLRSIITPRE
jgi:hypothetical protein